MRLFREESEERLDRVTEILLALERAEAPADAVDVVLRDVHSIKGAAGMLGLTAAGTVAHAMEDVLAEAREHGALPREAVEPLLQASDALRRAAEGEPIDPNPTLSGLEALCAPAVTDGEGGSGAAHALVPEEGQIGQGAGPGEQAALRRSLRVDAGSLDVVVDTVGEALLHQRRLEHLLQDDRAPNPEELDEALHRAAVRLDDLRHATIGLRMEPLSSITGPFPRMVRDLAAASAKEIELTVTGAETQLDRAVLGGASEAISHLLRNAVAHGIEPADEREAAGKPRRGTVELRARQEGARVAIEVSDDGGGVAPELVAKADGTTPLVRILAAPGLTRTERPTELAGRGVGLDAVLEHVQRLGGELDVRTESGRGTTFTLLVPISLALLHVLLAERGSALLGVPMSAVAEVVQMGDPLVLGGRTSMEVRGEQVPLADPVAVLGGAPEALPGGRTAVIVVGGGARAAFVVDAVVGDDELLVKPLGALLADIPGYLGAAVVARGGGRIALILDAAHLVPAAAQHVARWLPDAQASPPQASAQPTARILVVDDQFTAREIQRSILEAAGYSVMTARDGREAWNLLANGEDVQLVLTDLEMPEMDGLELVRSIRGDARLSDLPVVVVTSRGGEEDQRNGLEAGADAYVVKQRFDQRALLDTVERLTAA